MSYKDLNVKIIRRTLHTTFKNVKTKSAKEKMKSMGYKVHWSCKNTYIWETCRTLHGSLAQGLERAYVHLVHTWTCRSGLATAGAHVVEEKAGTYIEACILDLSQDHHDQGLQLNSIWSTLYTRTMTSSVINHSDQSVWRAFFS